MTRGFSEIFGFVDGVDVSSKMIEKAQESLSDCRNVALHINDGMKLSEFAGQYFDFIFSAIVFQHIPRKSIVRSYIREAARLLRPGCLFKFQVEGVPMNPRHADTWNGIGFSEGEMRKLASRCGFLVHSMTGAGTQYFWVTLVKR
jgi:ubiquinone/menaquinone biosynthesis C-methylase UbiE